MVRKIMTAAVSLVLIFSGCGKHKTGEQSYTSMKIDGQEYITPVMYQDMKYITGGNELFQINESSFVLRFQRKMSSSSGEVEILLRLIEDGIYTIGEEYTIPSDPSSFDDFSTARIVFEENGARTYYYAVDGWIKFDDVTEIQDTNENGGLSFPYYTIDGHFAFTAKEEHSGNIIEVTDGTFNNAMFVRSPGVSISSNW